MYKAPLEARERNVERVLELIARHPFLPASLWTMNWSMGVSGFDGPAAIRRYEAAWMAHIDAAPGSTTLLENGAAFLQSLDSGIAIRLLERAAKLEPRNPGWPQKIGDRHQLNARTDDREAQYSSASAALRSFEQALALTPLESARRHLYADLAECAWLVDRNDKAGTWARTLLKGARAGDHSFNDDTHHGHRILGLIALDNGDHALARKHLLQSADVGTSPVLGSFGPDMALAAALLRAGDRDGVVEFLDATRSFWKMGADDIDPIIAAIRSGETPKELQHGLRKLAGRKPPKG